MNALSNLPRGSADLHLHTTASDGRCTPEELVDRALAAGLRVISVTDHDTMAGVEPARVAGAAAGIRVIPGIEITSVHAGKDVHVLAYNLSGDDRELRDLLTRQRAARVERAREIGARLAALGAPIDVAAMLAEASSNSGKAIARPQIAQHLIKAGHVASVAEAFDRYLDERSPAYVPHTGASPADVVSLVVRLGGVASLAHPGTTRRDEIIPALKEAGMLCLEAYHSAHDEAMQTHYLSLAAAHGLHVTGGSDYHGEGTRRAEFFGRVGLPSAEFERFTELIESTEKRNRKSA